MLYLCFVRTVLTDRRWLVHSQLRLRWAKNSESRPPAPLPSPGIVPSSHTSLLPLCVCAHIHQCYFNTQVRNCFIPLQLAFFYSVNLNSASTTLSTASPVHLAVVGCITSPKRSDIHWRIKVNRVLFLQIQAFIKRLTGEDDIVFSM